MGKALIVALIASVIALGVVATLYASASSLWYSSRPQPQYTLSQKLEILKDYIVVQIGESNPFLDKAMKMCRNVTQVASFNDIESALQLVQSNTQKKVLVVFSSNYLDNVVSDQKFINSLRKLHNMCGEGRCAYIAIGNNTRRIFEALLYAGIHGRAPNNLTSNDYEGPLRESWNPPLAGVKFVVCTDGTSKWLATGILKCGAATVEGLVECIADWLQYKAPCIPNGEDW